MAPHDMIESYEEMLAPLLGHGFAYREIVNADKHAHSLPPRGMWTSLLPTLDLANDLRARMIKRGASGLRINAAYRPTGGASNSQHKRNRALDLDLLLPDYGLKRDFYEEAVKLWCERGRAMHMGLGLYCAADVCMGIRVHIDTGFYCRTWQHGGKPGVADAILIAKRNGWPLPTGSHNVERVGDDEGSDG